MHDLISFMGEVMSGLQRGDPRSLMRRFGLKPRKSLGQNFLVDRHVLGRIVSAASLTPDDVVIEVGAGLGILTMELADRAGRVIAVETDPFLVQALGEILAGVSNVHIVAADVLQTSPGTLLKGAGAEPVPRGYKVVANIPYYITSPILRQFLESDLQPSLMVIMVQKEVGEAITAKPGDMGILSASVQYYGEPVIAGRVPARSFHPAPKVDSVILQIKVRERPAVDVPAQEFFRVVRAGFSAPRKQLRNSLAQGLGISGDESARVLGEANIDPTRRAETLAIQEWARIAEKVREADDGNSPAGKGACQS